MKYAYFGLPQIGAEVLADEPKKIWELAMRYRNDKAKGDAFKQRFTGAPGPLSIMDKVNNTVGDLGAGAGLGLTMLGAKLRQYEPTKRMGTAIKTHGIDTLTNPRLQKMYGIGIPGAVGLGAAGVAGKVGYEALDRDEYD